MKGVLCTETALKLRRAARAAFVFDYRMLTCGSHESLFEAADSDGERPSVYAHLRRKIGPRMAHRALVTVSPAVLNTPLCFWQTAADNTTTARVLAGIYNVSISLRIAANSTIGLSRRGPRAFRTREWEGLQGGCLRASNNAAGRVWSSSFGEAGAAALPGA